MTGDHDDDTDDHETSSSTTNCNGGCEEKSCLQQLHMITSNSYQALIEYHVAQYTLLNPHISISLEIVDGTIDTLLTRLTAKDDDDDDWDGAIFPALLTGTLQRQNLLWDISTQAIDRNTEWSKVLPYFQKLSKYSTTLEGEPTIITMPLDGTIVSLYYRRDLLDQYAIPVPRTWEEYNEVAEFFDTLAKNTNGTLSQGSCVTRQYQCHNAYWTSMVLSSMTQTNGSSSGHLFNPATGEPNFGSALQETLRIIAEQHKYGSNDELEGECQNLAFAKGKCALTYTWGNQFIWDNKSTELDIGVAPIPGSLKVLDRSTGYLDACTTTTCPYATFYPDIGLVNRAPYAAFGGGWTSGINNSTTTTSGQKYATADFLSFIQSNALEDVLPNLRSNFTHPYQYSHTKALPWIQYAGVNGQVALEYSESLQSINSENAVLDLRIPLAHEIFKAMDEEIYSYLLTTREIPNMRINEANDLRKRVSVQIETRIRSLINDDESFLESYQQSVGYFAAPIESMNYINDQFRSAAYGLGGLICLGSLFLIIWTFLLRNNRVMKAFQPFLLIQCAVGCICMGGAIIPLGFDDSVFSADILNKTCMIAPWLYVMGFTVFFSSVYCKIRECEKIYEDPHKYKILFVSPQSAFQFTFRILLLNGIILGLWTASDPLRWERNEVEGGEIYLDGTIESFGLCLGGDGSVVFSLILYLVNLLFLLIGILRAFKCRFLVLEFGEMHWLTLSLIPFLECWLVGGPVVTLVGERPTVIFIILALIMAVSSIAGGMAIFAPKDWFVRKYRDIEPRSRELMLEGSSSSGILVLTHPTFQSQKELMSLKEEVEMVHAVNTELEIEIRGMKDRFKEMSSNGKVAVRQNLARAVMIDPLGSSHSKGRSLDSSRPKDMVKERDELVALEQSEKVWKMPHDEDEDPPELIDASSIPGTVDSFSLMKKETSKGPTRRISFKKDKKDAEEGRRRGVMNKPAAGVLPIQRKDGVLGGNAEMGGIEEESESNESFADASEAEDPEALIKRKDFHDLNTMINSDDLSALGTKAELLAESLKEKIAGSNLYGKASRNEDAPIVPAEKSSKDTNIEPSIEVFLASSILQSSGQSSGEPLKNEGPREEEQSEDTETANRLTEANIKAMDTSEPGRETSVKAMDTSESDIKANLKALGTSEPEKINGILSPGGGSNKKGGVKFRDDTLFNNGGSYNIGEWSAVGGISTILADFSDSSSFSSRTSSAYSNSSMEATTRASSLDAPFANELDTLVARKDWDGVQLVTTNVEALNGDEERYFRSSIEENKRKKRELEAWMESISSSVPGPRQLN